MIEEDIFDEIGNEVRREFTIALQRKIAECLDRDKVTNLTMTALGNTLIRVCIQNHVEKKTFLEKMSLGWDYHANQR